MKRILLILLVFCVFVSNSDAQTLKVGDKAPDIILSSPSGKTMSLSSLKGKMVLVDFWASWCGPCRKESPYIVRAYRKYKDSEFDNGDGFTVYSVSLDMKKAAWENAIKADNLNWPYHVSDLKGWGNAAFKTYGGKSIPANYLINGEGVIVAINLRGPALESKLSRLKKKIFFFF